MTCKFVGKILRHSHFLRILILTEESHETPDPAHSPFAACHRSIPSRRPAPDLRKDARNSPPWSAVASRMTPSVLSSRTTPYLIGYQAEISDDGQFALVEFVARTRVALAPINAQRDARVQIFRKTDGPPRRYHSRVQKTQTQIQRRELRTFGQVKTRENENQNHHHYCVSSCSRPAHDCRLYLVFHGQFLWWNGELNQLAAKYQWIGHQSGHLQSRHPRRHFGPRSPLHPSRILSRLFAPTCTWCAPPATTTTSGTGAPTG